MLFKFGLLIAAVCLGTAISKSTCPLSLDSEPICGSDGQTYEDICELARARSADPNLVLSSEGPCEEGMSSMQEEDEEDKPENVGLPSCDCPLETDPVCGSDGNTYENACILECAQSGNPLLKKAKSSACKESEEEDQSCECPDDDLLGAILNLLGLSSCCSSNDETSTTPSIQNYS